MEKLPPPTGPISLNEQLYYDMPRPEVPEIAFGVESEHLLNISRIVGNVATHAPDSLKKIANYTQKASLYGEEILRMSPLIEKIVQQEEVTATEVRPYRAVIKDIARQESTVFRWAEKATNFLSFFGIRKPKRMLNAYVEKKFVENVPEMVSNAVSYVKSKVDMAMSFVETLYPASKPAQQTIIPESWKKLIDSSAQLIPANVRDEFMSAINFAQSVMLQDNAKEEDKKTNSKTKNTSKIDKKEILNRLKTFFINRKSRAPSRAQ